MTRSAAAADRVLDRAADRNDTRSRCNLAHLACENCGICACMNDTANLDPTDYPNGKVGVRSGHDGTFCRECRYVRAQG
jgi:hypothetical protein